MTATTAMMIHPSLHDPTSQTHERFIKCLGDDFHFWLHHQPSWASEGAFETPDLLAASTVTALLFVFLLGKEFGSIHPFSGASKVDDDQFAFVRALRKPPDDCNDRVLQQPFNLRLTSLAFIILAIASKIL